MLQEDFADEFVRKTFYPSGRQMGFPSRWDMSEGTDMIEMDYCWCGREAFGAQ